jgi:hypothetical protein
MTLRESFEEINRKYKPLIDNAWGKYREIADAKQKEIEELFDYKGKFICVDDDDYLYVEEQFPHKKISNGEPVIVLRGQGFKYLITSYHDSTYATWDQFHEYDIEINSAERNISKIKIITKEEYLNKFEKMLEDIKKKHYKYIENL